MYKNSFIFLALILTTLLSSACSAPKKELEDLYIKQRKEEPKTWDAFEEKQNIMLTKAYKKYNVKTKEELKEISFNIPKKINGKEVKKLVLIASGIVPLKEDGVVVTAFTTEGGGHYYYDSKEKILIIGPYKERCPTQDWEEHFDCFVIKNPDCAQGQKDCAKWQKYPAWLDGFEYEPGYEYIIKIKTEKEAADTEFFDSYGEKITYLETLYKTKSTEKAPACKGDFLIVKDLEGFLQNIEILSASAAKVKDEHEQELYKITAKLKNKTDKDLRLEDLSETGNLRIYNEAGSRTGFTFGALIKEPCVRANEETEIPFSFFGAQGRPSTLVVYGHEIPVK